MTGSPATSTRWRAALLGLLILSSCAGSPPPPPQAPPGGPAPEAPESEPESREHDPTTARTFGWLSIAVGAEAAVVAGATSVLMLEDKSTRDADCNAQKLCSSDGASANTRLGATAAWNAGAFVLAAAGLGVGTYLLVTHPIHRHATLSVSPTGVDLTGHF